MLGLHNDHSMLGLEEVYKTGTNRNALDELILVMHFKKSRVDRHSSITSLPILRSYARNCKSNLFHSDIRSRLWYSLSSKLSVVRVYLHLANNFNPYN